MCGRRRQQQGYAYGYGGGCCGRRSAYNTNVNTNANTQAYAATAGVTGLIAAIQQMGLGDKAAGLPANNAQQYHDIDTRSPLEFTEQTNGVVYTPAATVFGDDEKHAAADFDKLPSYDNSVAGNRAGAAAVPYDNKQAAETVVRAIDMSAPVSQITQPGELNGARGVLTAELERFQSALASYRDGACGGRHQAKKAAKDLVKEMYAAEMARRRAGSEHLACGERKQIKRDLKPVKQMLKSIVWEARRERTGCC